MTDSLSVSLLAQTVPNRTPATALGVMQSRWQALDGILYRGFPVYVNKLDGTMVYEQDYDRLVSLPEEAEEAIVDILLLDFDQRSRIEEFGAGITRRGN